MREKNYFGKIRSPLAATRRVNTAVVVDVMFRTYDTAHLWTTWHYGCLYNGHLVSVCNRLNFPLTEDKAVQIKKPAVAVSSGRICKMCIKTLRSYARHREEYD